MNKFDKKFVLGRILLGKTNGACRLSAGRSRVLASLMASATIAIIPSAAIAQQVEDDEYAVDAVVDDGLVNVTDNGVIIVTKARYVGRDHQLPANHP